VKNTFAQKTACKMTSEVSFFVNNYYSLLFFAAYVQFEFVFFRCKNIGEKAVHEMLMKLASKRENSKQMNI